MFKGLFSKRSKNEDQMVNAIIAQTSEMLSQLHNQMDLRFKELSSQIKDLELSLVHMETKLLTKDLKDKQAYGLLHYKLHEVKNEKLDQEISNLENSLNARKGSPKDQ